MYLGQHKAMTSETERRYEVSSREERETAPEPLQTECDARTGKHSRE